MSAICTLPRAAAHMSGVKSSQFRLLGSTPCASSFFAADGSLSRMAINNSALAICALGEFCSCWESAVAAVETTSQRERQTSRDLDTVQSSCSSLQKSDTSALRSSWVFLRGVTSFPIGGSTESVPADPGETLLDRLR